MASTTTLATSSTRIGLRGILKPKKSNPWPDPQQSIGESWCTLGKNRCWEPVGPAQELIGKFFGHIKDLLESQHEYLNEGVCIPRAILFSLYMIGRTEDYARPTIMFSCENKAPRQRAVKIVRASKLLDDSPGVGLGDSPRPLILSRSPVQLGDQNPNEDVQMLDNVLVHYFPPLTDLYGIPITIRNTKEGRLLPPRKATIGGFISLEEELFGVTVAHIFLDDSSVQKSCESDAMEYSLEFESEDEVIDDKDEVEITSHGSASPEQSGQDDSASSDSVEYIGLQNDELVSLDTKSPTSPLSMSKQEVSSRQDVTMGANISPLGRMSAISQNTNTSNLDWALIQLDRQDVLSTVSKVPQFGPVQSFVKSMPARGKVQVITASNGILKGTIFGIPTFMQQPYSVAFQEMWTVRLDGPLQPGDCGSWVVDFDGKVLYGYITAGDPGTSIGYIIPAYQAFSDIEKQTGATVTFPSPEIRSERRQTGTDAHELPATALDCIEVLQHQRPLSDAGSLSTILTSDYLDNGILDRDSSLLERSGDVTGRDRSGETAELGLSGNLALNTQSNNHTGIIQKYASRIRKKIKVSFLTPKISPDHENSSAIPVRASVSDRALPLNAGRYGPYSPKRTLQLNLDDSALWKSLHNAAEENAMTLQGQLEIALVPWPRSSEQFFLPADAQDRLIIAPKVAEEFERLFPNLALGERSAYVSRTCSSARKFFAILLGIDKGESILDILSDGITDEDLPLVKYPKRSAYASCTTPYFALRAKRRIDRPIQTIDNWNWRTSIRQFYCEQWWLKAPVFDTLGKHYELEDDCVLPFVEDKEDINVNSGGYSDVWGVRIHPAHQKLFRSSNPQFPTPLIAVKRLHSTLKEDFDKEQSMLNSIAQKNHRHIVKLLATYRYKSRYHLLFPWAPCNLRVYWALNSTPGWNRTSVLWMLEQLEGLTCGLYEVHNFKIDKVKQTTLSPIQTPDPTRLLVPGTVTDISVAEEDYRYGRHGDLKPENILWSNELEGVDQMGVLQIADFGLGRFHGRASRSQMLAKLSTASPTYEPPEIPLNEKVSRAYDIWSLGCVFLEFITWRLGGKLLLGEFERLREVDGGDDTVNDKFFTVVNYKKPDQDAVVRREVLDWIETLLQHPSCSGALKELLAMVKDRMLVILPQKRIECRDLREHLVRLQKRAEGDDFFLLGNAPQTFTDVDNIQNHMVEKHGTPEGYFPKSTFSRGSRGPSSLSTSSIYGIWDEDSRGSRAWPSRPTTLSENSPYDFKPLVDTSLDLRLDSQSLYTSSTIRDFTVGDQVLDWDHGLWLGHDLPRPLTNIEVDLAPKDNVANKYEAGGIKYPDKLSRGENLPNNYVAYPL